MDVEFLRTLACKLIESASPDASLETAMRANAFLMRLKATIRELEAFENKSQKPIAFA